MITAAAVLAARYWKLALALAAIVAAFLAGVKVESNAREAQLATQERAFAEAFRQQAAKSRQIAQQLSMELNDAQSQRELDAVAYRKALQDSRRSGKALAVCPEPSPRPASPRPPLASAQARMPVPTSPPAQRALEPPGPPDEASGEPRFTGEFARLYDLALSIGRVPGTGDPEPADAAAEGAGTVDAETVLDVHGENAAAWAECRTRLKGWQDLARRHGWAK